MNLPDRTPEFSALDCGNTKVSRKFNRKNQVVEVDSQDPSLFHAYGKEKERSGDWQQAFEAYTRAAELDMNTAIYANDQGVALVMLNRLDEAETAFRKAMAIDPNFQAAWYNLQDLDIRRRSSTQVEVKDEALGASTSACRQDKAIDVAFLMDKIRQNPGNHLLWLALNPRNNDYWLKFGRALEATGEIAAAEELYFMLVEKEPQEYRGWNCLGVLLLMKGDKAGAEEFFRKALSINPHFPNARYNLQEFRGSSNRL